MTAVASESGAPKGTTAFIILTAFLNLMGVGIVAPVLNFLAGRYVSDPTQLAWTVSLLFASFSLFQFIATPTLGALSDRYGRRPILLISLLGSAVGYVFIGAAGALWVMFLGRIIDGITGGNISTIYAYAADISKPQDRTRFFGLIGSAAGMGFVIGPAIGALVYRLTGALEAPLYAAALVTLINVAWGYFAMPESLALERREPEISLGRLNPFTQLINVFRVPQIRVFLASILLWTLAFAVLQSNIAYLTEDRLGWTPDQTNALFFLIGIIQVITQGFLIQRVVARFGELRVAITGLIMIAIGFVIIGITSITLFAPLVFVASLFNAGGNGLMIPTSAALLSKAVTPREQGRIQGGNQSVQALGRVIGPLYGGWVYTTFSAAATYFSLTGLLLAAAGIAYISGRALVAEKAKLPTTKTEV